MSEKIRYKRLYDELKQRVATLADDLEFDGVDKDMDDEPWSTSRIMFVSNHMEVVDNEEYALKHWGKGKYRKFVLA